MGVKGLMSLLQDWDECIPVSIEELANDHQRSFRCGPVLVVDGSNFIPWFYAYRKDSLECIYGGQWMQFKKVLEEFVLQFKSKGIKLVFIFDGTICEEKLSEWAKRRIDRYREIASIFEDISRDLQEEVIAREWVSPAVKLLAKYALKELGVDMLQTDMEIDADKYIAEYANENKAVFGILSDDSDFIILETKPVLSAFKLKLKHLNTVMYDRHSIAEHYLNLPTKLLPLFACLMGNDYVPLKSLKQFHHRVANCEKPFKEAKARNLCNLIKRKRWTGDSTDERELWSISLAVFGHRSDFTVHGSDSPDERESCEVFRNGSDLLKHGLESYVIDKEALTLKLCVNMSPEFEKAVHERHFNCSNSCIYNLLCKKEYGSSEVLEDGSKLPSALVYREIRQRCYGILFNCSVDPGNLTSTVIDERCWYVKDKTENDLSKPEKIHPLPLRNASDVINIEELWFECSDRRSSYFFWHVLQVPMEFDLLCNLPQDQVALACILNYLIGGLKSGPLLEPLDVAVFVAQALWKLSPAAIKRLENPYVDASAVNLSTLFVNGIEPVLMALETCGFPHPYEYTRPWRFFDGKLFHILYGQAKRRPRVRVLCNDQDEIIKGFHQLLPVVTNNTVYDPVRFEWRNILIDFELWQNTIS